MDAKELRKLMEIAFQKLQNFKQKPTTDYDEGILYGQYIILNNLLKIEAKKEIQNRLLGGK